MNLAVGPNGQHMGLCWTEWQEFLKIEEGRGRGDGEGEGREKGSER